MADEKSSAGIMTKLIIVLFLFILVWCLIIAVSHVVAPDKKLSTFHKIFSGKTVVSGRGADEHAPQETLKSYGDAVSSYQNIVLRIDVWKTSDGIPAVARYEHIYNTSAAEKVSIESTDASDLKNLDPGYAVSPDRGKTFPYRNQGYSIPLLDQVLKAYPERRKLLLIHSRDTAFVDQVMKLLVSQSRSERAVVMAQNRKGAEIIRKNYPEVLSCYTNSENFTFFVLRKMLLSGFFSFKSDIILIPEYYKSRYPGRKGRSVKLVKVLGKSFVEEAHKYGIPVIAYDVNNKSAVKGLNEIGVDSFVTDYPGRIYTSSGAGAAEEPCE